MKVGFVGAGKMAEAILGGIVKAGVVAPGDMAVADPDPKRRRVVKARYAVAGFPDNPSLARAADMLVLAVKPQDLTPVLEELAPHFKRGQLVVSIVAGRKTETLESLLPGARVVRVMPNLPSVVGCGMSVVCEGRSARRGDGRKVSRLLGCCGKTVQMEESHFDAVTALSGSGPAFFCYLLQALAEAGVKEGLDRKTTLLLLEQTMLGTAKLLMEQALDPAELIVAVASPKGTTVAGLAVLEPSPVAATLHATIRAAARRSAELSR